METEGKAIVWGTMGMECITAIYDLRWVAFTRKPTIEMVKRRLRTFVLAYYDEVDFNINKFDFEPYN